MARPAGVVTTSSTIAGVSLEALTVALFERITEDLLILSLVSVAVAFSGVSPVFRTLRVKALPALCVRRTDVHAPAIALLASGFVIIVSVAVAIIPAVTIVS